MDKATARSEGDHQQSVAVFFCIFSNPGLTEDTSEGVVGYTANSLKIPLCQRHPFAEMPQLLQHRTVPLRLHMLTSTGGGVPPDLLGYAGLWQKFSVTK